MKRGLVLTAVLRVLGLKALSSNSIYSSFPVWTSRLRQAFNTHRPGERSTVYSFLSFIKISRIAQRKDVLQITPCIKLFCTNSGLIQETSKGSKRLLWAAWVTTNSETDNNIFRYLRAREGLVKNIGFLPPRPQRKV